MTRGLFRQSQFGTFNKVRIHEKGVSYTKNNLVIPWDNVYALYYFPVKHVTTFYFIPVDEHRDATFTIVDRYQNMVRFTVNNTQEDTIYKLFIDNLLSRLWEDFYNTLNDSSAMVFGKLALSLQSIYEARRLKNGSFELKNDIKLQNIKKYYVKSGKIIIEHVDNNGKLKKQSYGDIGSTPNFFIIHYFLHHIVVNDINPR